MPNPARIPETAAPEALGVRIHHKRPPLKALTAIRFFAAVYVVVFHGKAETFALFAHVPLLNNFINSGFTGVILFFVLSGFILSYNYEVVRSKRSFWISRFARIYPIYFLALLFSLILSFAALMADPPRLLVGLALSLLVVQAWFRPYASFANAPAWTLSVEALFYAVFPFALPLLKRMRLPAFIAFCGAYVLFESTPFFFAQAASTRAFGGSMNSWIDSAFPPARLPAFLIGMYAGIAFCRPKSPPASWQLPLGAASALLLLVWNPQDPLMPLRSALLALAFAAMIYGLASVPWRVLTNRWMQIAGEISYGVYILQMPVIRSYRGLARHFHSPGADKEVFYLPVLLLVAYALYRAVEIPARLAIRRALTHRAVPVEQI